ncbi:hypothetical protein COF47_22825 [Bacillus wiedmannii]|uniref:hypothetical protein n=1 Tax=Bacillus wiedmannii TaxID=1890302 RepID=UPI000BFC14CC|nr:hypothetical protein [Bacillus wiedmannii]PHE73270.1 hypothetical protein COF47_22825 [Bacillus wiedmannii]
MAKKWTIQNAVKKFKPNLIDSLKGNNGNLNKHSFNSLIKEMKCFYEEVTFEGKGRDRIIYTDKKRKEKVKKEDRRQFNKGTAPLHSKHLALMVMSKIDGIDYKARTRNGWAKYFGLISPAEQDIMNGIYSEEVLKPYKESMIRLGIMENGEEKMLQDLAYTLSKIAKGQLQTVLNQAEKMELIRRISSWKGKVKGSNEPISIDESLAFEIKFIEEQLLKKHEISKKYSLMFKNCPKTKAFKAEWLEYIENVEDEEGNVLHLQYIYEVFQIEVLNKYAFNEYITAHYPNEIDSFDLHENEQAYHCKLLDYVVENAQKKHDNYLKKKHDKKVQLKDGTIELMVSIGLSEEEAVAYVNQLGEESYNKENEQSPYMDLLESDEYVECIRKLHNRLHSISTNESKEIKAVQHIIDEDRGKELEQLGLSNAVETENQKSIKKDTLNYHESSLDAIERIEKLIDKEQNKKQANQAFKESVVENIEQQGRIRDEKPNGKPLKRYNAEKDRDIDHMMIVDAVIRDLQRDVTVEEVIGKFRNELQHKQEQEREKWKKLFEDGQPVTRELTTNNPLEVFHRIKHGRVDKENS